METPEKKQHKKFKDYYQEDPEYRRRHLDKLMEKVECPKCGVSIGRCNMTRHQKSRNCKMMK